MPRHVRKRSTNPRRSPIAPLDFEEAPKPIRENDREFFSQYPDPQAVCCELVSQLQIPCSPGRNREFQQKSGGFGRLTSRKRAVVQCVTGEILYVREQGIFSILAGNIQCAGGVRRACALDLKGKGLGWRLMQHLIAYASSDGLKEIYGQVLAINGTMLKMCSKLGFEIEATDEDIGVRLVRLKLASPLRASNGLVSTTAGVRLTLNSARNNPCGD
jgi:RimJ/RimL family protein N-acetyltransferase